MSIRDDRMLSILVHLAGEFIAREAGRATLITPTRAELSSDGKRATVFVSVFPDSEVEHALVYLDRQRDEFRTFLRKKRLSAPQVTFAFDTGEQNRQRLDDLSREAESR